MRTYAIAVCIFLSAGTLIGRTEVDRPFLSHSTRYDSVRMENARKNFISDLQCDNDGVVQSTIAHVVHMRVALPRNDMARIQRILNELATNGHTSVIRYEAYLATVVFNDPLSFTPLMAEDYESSDGFFSAVALHLQRTLFTHEATSQR
jgi:hypothetical protein